MIVVEGGQQFQVATFRAEADYRDGRRPTKVVFASAEADAPRRDFTVNGLFYDPLTEKIHDWVGGEKDLRAKIIRTIGKPEERFGEDHLRLLRAVRFAAQLNFEIEPRNICRRPSARAENQTHQRRADSRRVDEIFAPSDEWSAGLRPGALRPGSLRAGSETGAPAARGLVLLRDSGLLEQILPELAATISCEQSPDYHPEGACSSTSD